MSFRSWLGVCLLAVAAAAFADVAVPQVNSGHRMQVTALQYDASRGLLFSAADDGLVVVWDVAGRGVSSRLQVSHLPVRFLAVHPTLPVVAVVESDVAVNRLSVWDYAARRRLVSMDLDVPPSSVSYSSTGRYLVVCRERFDSILVLDPTTGARLPFFLGGFGIVGFVTFNSDDSVMMSYQVSGEVRYWDMASQTQRLRTLTTEPFLRLVSLGGSPDSPKDSLIGSSGRVLVVADIVRTGAVKERAPVPDIVSLSASDRGEVASLSRSETGVVLARWQYRSGVGLLRLGEQNLEGTAWPGGSPAVVALGPGGAYVGCTDGSIVTVPAYGAATLFARNELAAVSDIALDGRWLIVAVPGGVLQWDTALLAAAAAAGSPEAPVERQAAPFPTLVRLVSGADPGELWAWAQDGESRELRRIAPGSPGGVVEVLSFPDPVKAVSFSGKELCVVERSGRCSILARTPGGGGYVTVFEYASPGANTMVSAPGAVLVGRSTPQRGDSPLLLVDRRTGETVPLPAGDGLVYDLIADPGSNGVLSLEVGRDQAARTMLVRRSGPQYVGARVLREERGDDTGADVALGFPPGTFYTSLGYLLSRVGEMGVDAVDESTLRAPRRLAAGPEMVASLNADGSVTLWRATTLEPLADLYVFRDGEWLAVSEGGASAGSPGGLRRLAAPRRAAGQP